MSRKHQEQGAKSEERLKLLERQLEEERRVSQASQAKIAEKNRLINELLLVI